MNVNSHAVPGSQVSVDELLAGQILHPSGHLQAEAHQVLHRRVLEGTRPSEDWNIYIIYYIYMHRVAYAPLRVPHRG